MWQKTKEIGRVNASMARALTDKERAFVENYFGNAREAAKAAGYCCKSEKNFTRTGQLLLKKPRIIAALAERDVTKVDPNIANREQRARWLTEVMRDDSVKIEARLRACELLCKMNGDFIDRAELAIKQDTVVRVLDQPMQLDILRMAKQLTSQMMEATAQSEVVEADVITTATATE